MTVEFKTLKNLKNIKNAIGNLEKKIPQEKVEKTDRKTSELGEN